MNFCKQDEYFYFEILPAQIGLSVSKLCNLLKHTGYSVHSWYAHSLGQTQLDYVNVYLILTLTLDDPIGGGHHL